VRNGLFGIGPRQALEYTKKGSKIEAEIGLKSGFLGPKTGNQAAARLPDPASEAALSPTDCPGGSHTGLPGCQASWALSGRRAPWATVPPGAGSPRGLASYHRGGPDIILWEPNPLGDRRAPADAAHASGCAGALRGEVASGAVESGCPRRVHPPPDSGLRMRYWRYFSPGC